MTGAEDLDRHGRWEEHPDYGAVWIPTVVVAGWAPYRARPLGLGTPMGLDLGRRRRPGVSRPSTTAAGCGGAAAGAGRRARGWRARCMRRRWSAGSGAGRRCRWPSAAAGAGGRLGAAGTARGLPARLPRQRRLCRPRQCRPRHPQAPATGFGNRMSPRRHLAPTPTCGPRHPGAVPLAWRRRPVDRASEGVQAASIRASPGGHGASSRCSPRATVPPQPVPGATGRSPWPSADGTPARGDGGGRRPGHGACGGRRRHPSRSRRPCRCPARCRRTRRTRVRNPCRVTFAAGHPRVPPPAPVALPGRRRPAWCQAWGQAGRWCGAQRPQARTDRCSR